MSLLGENEVVVSAVVVDGDFVLAVLVDVPLQPVVD